MSDEELLVKEMLVLGIKELLVKEMLVLGIKELLVKEMLVLVIIPLCWALYAKLGIIFPKYWFKSHIRT